MKKTKKILALVLCLVLAIGAVSGTLAYLTDRDSEVNTFTVGDVKIELDETFEQGATLMPGIDIEKVVKVENVGKNDAWVWVTIAIPDALDDPDASKNVIHFNYDDASVVDGQWKWMEAGNWADVPATTIDGKTYALYTVLYQTKLGKGSTTETSAMTKVYLDKQVDIDPEGNWYKVNAGVATPIKWNTNEDGAPQIYVSAYAIQADGFDTVQEAYAAYQAQWGANGTEYAEVPAAPSVSPAP